MQRLSIAAASALLALAGCEDEPGAVARNDAGDLAPTAAGGVGSAALPTTTAEYLASAGSSDLYEVQSSRLIAGAPGDPALRSFARTMIEHHIATTRALHDAARQSGIVPPPPTLQPKHAMLIEQLRAQPAEARAAAYLAQQRTAHQEALALHQGYADNGDTDALRRAAAAAVPIVQQHLTKVQELATQQ